VYAAAAIKEGELTSLRSTTGLAPNITNFVAEAKGVEVLSMEILW
jgi:hypothetical protein